MKEKINKLKLYLKMKIGQNCYVKYLLLIFLLFVIFLALLSIIEKIDALEMLHTQEKSECEVTIVHDATIKLEGILDPDCYKRFSEIVEGKEQNIELLLITSKGGNAGVGLSLGRWVHKNKVKLEVKNYCNSSCANYIFPAATKKFIQRDSIVAWHGSEAKEYSRAHAIAELSNGKYTVDDVLKRAYISSCGRLKGFSLSDCQGNDLSVELKSANEISEFYDEIGISTEIMNYGLWGKHADKKDYELVEKADGDLLKIRSWTITIDKMEELGISNVTYQGGNENYPNKKSEHYESLKRGLLED